MRKVGSLAIVIVALVATAHAVPRYSAPVPQVDDSSNNVAAQHAPGKMNSERGGVGKEIIVDALKGCRDGATIGIVSGSLKGGVAGGVAGGPSGAVAGAAAGALSGAAAGCVNGMITGVAKGAAVRAINVTSPTTSNETSQNPVAAIRQTAQTCQGGTRYITCAYTREIKTLGKPAHAVAGDKGLHYQLIIFDKNTGKPIASYGKTTWKETPLIGQGTMLMEKPDVKDGYNPIPRWCIESESISVLPPEGYVIGGKDCREYAGRIKDDLLKNHGGKEISAPTFAFLEVNTKHSPDTTETTIGEAQAEKESVREEHSETLSDTNIASQMSMADMNTQVGVRGWCECGDDHGKLYEAGTMFGQIVVMGAMGMSSGTSPAKGNEKARQADVDAANKMVRDARYSYILCAKCGKCRKPSADPDTVDWDRIDWKDEWVIMDSILEFQLQGSKGRSLSTAQTVRARLAPQKEFMKKFPNGGVLFPGVCVCKVPDAIHVGFLESGYSPCVCLLCGHERLPDENGSIPNGPTALREMGLDEKARQEEKRMEEWLASLIQSTRD